MKRVAAALLSAAAAGCLQAPPAAGGGDGGGGDGDGGPGGPCGTAGALEDEFDGDELDGELWGGTGGVTAGGGTARIVSGPGQFNVLNSTAYYRVSGSQMVAELDLSDIADDTRVDMELDTTEFQAGIRLENGEMAFVVVDESGERTFDDAMLQEEHVWWRIREEAGEFFWATSPDGAGWTERGPFAGSIGELANIEFQLIPNSQSSTLIVNAVNSGTSVRYCAAASFTDNFGTLSAPLWQEDEQGDCVVSLDGQAVLGYSTQAFCALTARQRLDLRDSALAVELVEVGDCKPEPIMLVTLVGGEELAILCRDEGGVRKLVADYTGAGEVSEINYDPALHRFVRLRHDPEGGKVEYEALDAATTGWTSFGSVLVEPGDLAHTGLRFYLGGEPTTTGEFESVSFDSLNLAPL